MYKLKDPYIHHHQGSQTGKGKHARQNFGSHRCTLHYQKAVKSYKIINFWNLQDYLCWSAMRFQASCDLTDHKEDVQTTGSQVRLNGLKAGLTSCCSHWICGKSLQPACQWQDRSMIERVKLTMESCNLIHPALNAVCVVSLPALSLSQAGSDEV